MPTQYIKNVLFRSLRALFFLLILCFSSCKKKENLERKNSTDKEIIQLTVGAITATKILDNTKGQIGPETVELDGTTVLKAIPITVIGVAPTVDKLKKTDISVSEKTTVTQPSEDIVTIEYTGNSQVSDPISIVITDEHGIHKYYALRVSKKNNHASITAFSIKLGHDEWEAIRDEAATGTSAGSSPDQPLVYTATLPAGTPNMIQALVGAGGLEVSTGSTITQPAVTNNTIKLAVGTLGTLLVVTAEDGVTSKYYKFVLTRPEAPVLMGFKLAGILADIPKPGEVNGKDGATEKTAIPIKLLLPSKENIDLKVSVKSSTPKGNASGQLEHAEVKEGITFSSHGEIKYVPAPGVLGSFLLGEMVIFSEKPITIAVVEKGVSPDNAKKTFYVILVIVRPRLLKLFKITSDTLVWSDDMKDKKKIDAYIKRLEDADDAPFQISELYANTTHLFSAAPTQHLGNDKEHAIEVTVIFKTGTYSGEFSVVPLLALSYNSLTLGATIMATNSATPPVTQSVKNKHLIEGLKLGDFGTLTAPADGSVSTPATPATTGKAAEQGKPYVKVSVGTGENQLTTWYKFIFKAQKGTYSVDPPTK